jgi:peptidoglycan hydrolase-like protein with peptidoglycan-binding domain
MSRSVWALAGARRCGRLVHPAGEPGRLAGWSRFGPRFLPGAVSAAKCAVVLVAVGLLVIAVDPARALGASGRAQAVPLTVGRVVLAAGSGYAGGRDAALVRSLQRRLGVQGFSPGAVDGRYGPRTERAVELFQRARGLRADGVAGPVTLGALRTMVLYPGMGFAGVGSSRVRGLQRQLRRDGVGPGPIDGRYGPLTQAAVRRFQAGHGLRVDGIAGPRTLGELDRIAAATRPSTRPTTPTHRTTTQSHARPVAPPATQPSGASGTHPGSTPHPGALAWLVALGLVGVLAVAALTTGMWLMYRRRDPLAVQPQSGPEPEPTPEPGPESVFVEGEEFSDPVAAELAFRQADELGDPAAASNLGVLLEQRGDLAAAEAAYRRADARGSAHGAFNLAGLLHDRGDLQGAMWAYRRADIRGDGTAASNLARLLASHGDPDAAEDAFARAEDRGDPSAAASLGVLLEHRGDVQAAEAAYRRADTRGDPDGAHNLGELLEKHGDLDAAAAAYTRADRRGHHAAAAKLGMLLERQHDYPAALQAYTRAQTSNQKDVAELAKSRAQALAFGLSLAEKGHQ